ncbi:MAG: amino acid ABC transporter permease [Chloroflexi bacterium]|nr:amino acid ABC transporter permease [Chloroflexota bacterium]
MSEKIHRPDETFYVAPKEPPASRRPPALTIGPVGWLRKNLFSGVGNTLMTGITISLIVAFLYELITWSIVKADWNVVNNTMRLMMVGLYPIDQIWRIQLIAVLLVFLSGLGVGVWGGNARGFFIISLIIIIAALIIPLGAERIEPPSIRFIVTSTDPNGPILFVGDEGDTVGLTVEPIDDNAVAKQESPFTGFIENSAGASSSRALWNNAKAQVVAGKLDLSQYNLQMTVQLLDSKGKVLDESLSTPAHRVVNFEFKLPANGWYIVQVLRDDTGDAIFSSVDGLQLPVAAARALPNTGFAWVRIDGVNAMSAQQADVEQRTKTYGGLPTIQCPSTAECRRQLLEENVRYEGSRTFKAFLKTQLDPFLAEIIQALIVGFVVMLVAYSLGNFAKQSRNPASKKLVSRAAIIGWVIFFPLSWMLLSGFKNATTLHPFLELPQVAQSLWGGLILTIVLTFVSLTFAFPIGILLALGRRSKLPIISLFCVLFIEIVRGVPLITILFMAKFIVPYFAKSLSDTELLIRLLVGLTLFTAAYNAEVVRGGLQIIPKGQIEAAQALGLNPFATNVFIVLPQALRAVIPAIMSQSVSLFKDTTLVSIVGLFEFLGMIELIVNGQQVYRPYQREAYLFIGVIYFIISYIMSSLSRRLEESGAGTVRKMRKA